MEIPESLHEQIGKAAVLVEALPYMQRFRGQTFLIKMGGSAMEDAALVEGVLRDVVFLEAVGVNPVLVHGGGKAISAAMVERGLEAKFIGGLRVTDESAIEIVEETLSQRVNPVLVRGIEKMGGRARGVAGKDVFIGEQTKTYCEELKEEVDLGYVGKVVDFNPEPVDNAVHEEIVPVVTPLAAERTSGHTLNVNADVAAAALAGKLGAAKLVFLSDVLGVMRDPSDVATLIHSIGKEEVEGLISDRVISGGMIPKVRSAVEALDSGVGKVHMVDGRIPHSLLLEIFTDEGIGTEIRSSEKV